MGDLTKIWGAEKKVGYYYTYFSTFISIILSIVLIGIGYYLIYYNEKGWISTKGVVTKITQPCIRTETKNNVNYNCGVTVSYDGYSANTDITQSNNVGVGTSIDLAYNPSNPKEIDVGMNKKTLGYILLVVGIIMFAFALIIYHFRDNKWVQTWMGMRALRNIF